MANLSLSIFEVLGLLLGAIVLGITIHFFIVSRRNLKSTSGEREPTSTHLEDWKVKYFNDGDVKDKELTEIRKRMLDAEENNKIYAIELEEIKRQNKKLSGDLEITRKSVPRGEKPDYVEQLRQAQFSLMEHNEKVNQLLQQIDMVKETEEKQNEMIKENEALNDRIRELNNLLGDREKEINKVKQKEQLTNEMSAMLDNAYSEFNTLQSKIQKLESQVASTRMLNMEYEDIKESFYKQSHEFEAIKTKLNTVTAENQQLALQLHETEDRLLEANFQRQQLQKRVGYLEELNNDLQVMSDANKKLEGQIKRMGELESKINVISEERDELLRKQPNS